MPNLPTPEQINSALESDRTIDIVTIGAKSGQPRTIEIWFTNINGQIIICGTPAAEGGSGVRSKRDWLANMSANPNFLFCLKESFPIKLTAYAHIVSDREERRALMSAPETQWYRDQVDSVDQLINGSPIVRVEFTGEFESLNR